MKETALRPSVRSCGLAIGLLAASAALAGEAEAPMVSAVVPVESDLVERASITGTLVARDEVLVAPEIDGVRVA